MIKKYKNKGLKELFETGKSRLIDKKLHARILRRLDALNAAEEPEDLNLPGFNFHGLKGFKPKRYTIHVNGPWCITFTFENGHASEVDFENYHQN
jgi:proteic killer suppression protein